MKDKQLKINNMENGKQPMYPRTAFDQSGDITTWNDEYKGLTKREYFAAIAMQSASNWLLNPSKTEIKSYAEMCVQMADALLEQLEKQ